MTIFPALFHPAFPHPTSAPSGHLFPFEGGSVHASPFPWKGLAERSEAGLASFFAAKPPPLCLPHAGKALSIVIRFPHILYSL